MLSLEVVGVARGVEHQLEPAYVKVAYLSTAGRLLISTPLLVGALVVTQLFSSLTEMQKFALWGLLVAKLLFNVIKGYYWPRLEYRHARYMLDDDGVQIQRGVLRRIVTSIPRSRVQHVDLAQGVWERRYGLATLVIHTAASGSPETSLRGVSRATAEEIRNYLKPQAFDDAV
ncbi:MAG: PH domain-containing protein [Phycisphaerae bacterium]|nr:PH domain-containing protein [Gemmatimonadaceae bacterium]